MGDVEFEHLTRALAIAVFGASVEVFGVGSDGGREATFEGSMSYPDGGGAKDNWNGYLVIQAKFREEPRDVKDNARWLRNAIQREINEWKDEQKRRRTNGRLPEYLLFTTNVLLSSVPGVGGIDEVNVLLARELPSLGVRGWALWHGDKIYSLLDNNQGIRNRYNAFLMAGDLLSQIQSQLQFDGQGLEAIYETHSLKSLRREQWVRLDESGADRSKRLPLSQIAIDLPHMEESGAYGGESGVLRKIVMLGDRMLRPGDEMPAKPYVVVVGGPGQGKSTLGLLLCQAYRLALLQTYPASKLAFADADVLKAMRQHLVYEMGVPLPLNRRWPVLVRLSELGDALTSGKSGGLLRFIAEKMNDLIDGDAEVTPAKLKSWLRIWPWMIVLDGLDEVPASSSREKVFEAIDDFLTDAKSVEADVFVVATTRPQGYVQELSPESYEQLTLAPLTAEQSVNYVKQLAAVQYPGDEELQEHVVRHAKIAVEREATSRLMVTPLQVTIMSLLLAKRAKLPESRHELFSQYFSTIYEREMNKEPSYLARLLREQRRNVQRIHERVGITLQQRAEDVGHADALLTNKQFESVIAERLTAEDFPTVDLRRITSDLAKAALDRLVLLVPRKAEHVGFELRSLQEFMAASYFFSLGDNKTLDPFERTATSAHWRHTWLLGVGQLFEEREILRDGLVSLVGDVGHRDEATGTSLIGPMLAVDLLDDDIAADAPKYLRRLTRYALEALGEPPGSHTEQLNRVLRESAERDTQAWTQVKERTQASLDAGSGAKISAVWLLAALSTRTDNIAAHARAQLNTALKGLSKAESAALVWFLRERPELMKLGILRSLPIEVVGLQNLGDLIAPYMPAQAGPPVATGHKLLLKELRSISATKILAGEIVFYAVDDIPDAARYGLLDLLRGSEEARYLISNVIRVLPVENAPVGDFLRTQLRAAISTNPARWDSGWAQDVRDSIED
ncbi:hypothetical protein DQ354_19305 [Arthrobacter sp. AQ5-06]|nr:hypothetical protein DQ354_19305 [Arthrobacter sp. AQ5-06]